VEKINCRILIIGNKDRFIHLKQFVSELNQKNIDVKLAYDLDFIDKFFELNIKKKIDKKERLNKLLSDFKPDIVVLDRISKIGKKIIERKIPLWILLRGNYWEELLWAKKTIYKSRKQKLMITRNEKLTDYCFSKSDLILPISKYLENEVKKRYPKKNIKLFSADGRDPEDWFPITVQKLKHPCVGLVQGLNIWGKSKELLTLKNVLKGLPQVTFYLAGDGIYRNEIIPQLENFENFVWLKNLRYPGEIKEFFSEIDIFLLLSGMEGLGQTIIEALLMKKPTIATNVGGIPELIRDNENGLLVKKTDDKKIIQNITKLLTDSIFANEIAETGYNMVKQKYSWKAVAEKFFTILKENGFRISDSDN